MRPRLDMSALISELCERDVSEIDWYGVGPSPSVPKEGTVPNEDLSRAMQLLQGLMTSEDFSKYEKMVSPPKREESQRS